MKIKKIKARNFSEALSMVKRELGDDAVILSTEDAKGRGKHVEVTAAVDHELNEMNNGPGRMTVQNSALSSYGKSAVKTAVETDDSVSRELLDLKSEISGLKSSIESMKNKGFELNLPKERKRIYQFLKNRSIKDEFAFGIAEKVRGIDDIPHVMKEDMKVEWNIDQPVSDREKIEAWNGRKVIMLIGPTGVGKTTTLAKLASQSIREGKKVAMISYDTFKIGAAEQIRIYSRMIGIPLDIVSDTDSLKESVRKHSDRDLILMDTTGQNPRDTEYIAKLEGICNAGLPLETQLLLSTSSDCGFLIDNQKHYSSLPVDYIAFTKTDEALQLGSMYNLSRVYQKPVAYITTGQGVPGNIEFIDSNKLTNLILRTGSA